MDSLKAYGDKKVTSLLAFYASTLTKLRYSLFINGLEEEKREYLS